MEKRAYTKFADKKLTAEQSQLAADYYPLACKIACKFMRPGGRMNEAIQDAAVSGLISAVWSYPPSPGGKPGGWIRRKVIYEIKDAFRNYYARPLGPELVGDGDEYIPAPPLPLDIEEFDAFLHAARGLPPAHATVVRLVYFDGMHQREAGEVMGLSPTRVSKIIAQSLALLREFRTA